MGVFRKSKPEFPSDRRVTQIPVNAVQRMVAGAREDIDASLRKETRHTATADERFEEQVGLLGRAAHEGDIASIQSVKEEITRIASEAVALKRRNSPPTDEEIQKEAARLYAIAMIRGDIHGNTPPINALRPLLKDRSFDNIVKAITILDELFKDVPLSPEIFYAPNNDGRSISWFAGTIRNPLILKHVNDLETKAKEAVTEKGGVYEDLGNQTVYVIKRDGGTVKVDGAVKVVTTGREPRLEVVQRIPSSQLNSELSS